MENKERNIFISGKIDNAPLKFYLFHWPFMIFPSDSSEDQNLPL